MGQYLDDKGVLAVWARIKAYAVMGHPIDQTSYNEAWRVQARKNLGMEYSKDKMLYGAESGLASVTTSVFGRSLLNAASKTVFTDLYADRAQKDLDGNVISTFYLGKGILSATGNEGSATRPIYLSGYKAAPINGLSVPGNIESTNGGVSAKGISDLSASFGGGGTGSVNKIKYGNVSYSEDAEYEPDYLGVITLPKRPDLSIYATKEWSNARFALVTDMDTLKGYMPANVSSTNKLATQSQVSAINGLIPAEATTANQLADKAFVNSSIGTATATFRGTVETTATLKALEGDLNDYAFYKHTDADGNTVFDRYKYVSTASSAETGKWVYEYTLNNSSFTADQWSAINSGITSEGVEQIGTNQSNITTLQGYFSNGVANTAAKLNNTSKIGDTNKPVYFNANGVPVAISYTIGRNVAANEDVTPYTGAANGNIGISEHKISINMAEVQTPAFSGNGIDFVDSVTQATNGSITVHTKRVQQASRTQMGVVNTISQEFSGDKKLFGNFSAVNGGVAAMGICDLSVVSGSGSGVVDLYTNWNNTPTDTQALGATLAKAWHDAWLTHIASGVGAAVTPLHVSASEKAAWNAKWDYNADTIKGVKVNNAGNADTLESHAASYFATASSVTTLQGYFENGVAKSASNASMLENHSASYFATATGLTAVVNGLSDAVSDIEDIKKWKLSPNADTMEVGTLSVATINLGGEEYSSADDIIGKASASATYAGNAATADKVNHSITIQKNGTKVGESFDGSADRTINLTDVASAATLTTEITERKANDVASITIGTIGTRGQAADNNPALKFNRTDGKHLDIPRGTEVDIIASNLVGDALPQKDQMFGYRTTAGDASIKPTGTAHIDKLSGNTIVWNQMMKNPAFKSDKNDWLTTSSSFVIENGVARVGGATQSSALYQSNMNVVSGHKILFLTKIKNQTSTTYFYIHNSTPGTASGGTFNMSIPIDNDFHQRSVIVTIGTAQKGILIERAYNNAKNDTFWYLKYLYTFDLTQMFGDDASICKALGVANLDTTDNQTKAIANFKALFPNSYYPYNAGELVSFGECELETIGRNAFDLESGKARLLASTYKIEGAYTSLSFLGADGTTITPSVSGGQFTTTQEGVLTIVGGDDTTCVYLPWSGSRTGYEPYSRHTLPVTPYVPEEFKKKAYNLGDLVLHEGAMYKRTANGGVKKDWVADDWTMIRCAGGGIGQALSAGAVRDEYYEDHCVIRVGSTLMTGSNWVVEGSYAYERGSLYSVMQKIAKKPSNNAVFGNITCVPYPSVIRNSMASDSVNNVIALQSDSTIIAKDSSITTKAQAEAKFQGQILYFELAEPITIYYDKKDFGYFADDYGTEGWIPQTGSTPRFVPPYMDITYGINVVDEVRQLPAKYFESKQFTQSNVTELFKENKEVSNQMLVNLGSNLETVYGDGTDPNRLMGFELAMGFDESGEEKSVTFGIITDEWINQNLN